MVVCYRIYQQHLVKIQNIPILATTGHGNGYARNAHDADGYGPIDATCSPTAAYHQSIQLNKLHH